MPKITEYTAPDRKLTQSTEGVAAFETAARRIGPAYQQAATDTRDIGRLQAQTDKERLWPWDILELYDAEAKRQNTGGGGGSGGGGGVKTIGGGSPGSPGRAPTYGGGGGGRGAGQLSRAAAAIGDTAGSGAGKLARGGGGGGGGGRSKLIDVGDPALPPGLGKGPITSPFDPDDPRVRTEVPGLYDPGREVWRDPNPLPPLPGQNPDGTFGGQGGYNPGPATYGDPTAPTPDYSNEPVPLPGPIKDFIDWSGQAPNPDESDNYQGSF